jgi:hypothetical protein
MKKIILLLPFVFFNFFLIAQNAEKDPAVKNPGRFFAGLSYAYLDNEMKLSSLSIHSVWQEVDFGTDEFTPDELDEINSFAERQVTVNDVMLEAGMILFDKPDSKWSIDGSILLGLSKVNTETFNTNTDSLEIRVESGFSEPSFGVGFNVDYRFSLKWGLRIRPVAVVAFGKSDDITDNLYVKVDNYTEVRENMFTTVYERLSIMAAYTAGNFTIAAGPGFYYAHSHHEYTVERTNKSTGDVLLDEINSGLVPRSFVDGVVAAEWRFFDPLSLNVYVGVGKDIVAKAGLYYQF